MPPDSPPVHDPYAAFRVAAYRSYWIGGFASVIGRQMLALHLPVIAAPVSNVIRLH